MSLAHHTIQAYSPASTLYLACCNRQDYTNRETMETFLEKLDGAALRNHSLLCVGLDIYPGLLPVPEVAQFNGEIIEATKDLVCAYKPNLGFYEALGLEGLRALEHTLAKIPRHIPVIGDAKRGDIGSTSRAYAKALFQGWGFDATTVNPYMGSDAVEPFLEYLDRGVFILCRTSNPGSDDFQSLTVADGLPLYQRVAQKAAEWNIHGNVGLVVGATYPSELQEVRRLCHGMPILIPGVGAQGGDLEASVQYGTDDSGRRAIINASRQILYASKEQDFALAARREAQRLRDAINQVLGTHGWQW